jgi:aryl-alcohol dehydrogenase-like predicted oxidoreductase
MFSELMEITRTAFGTWNGGRFMHFGEPLEEERYLEVIQLAYQTGIRTFMTSDVYGNGEADSLLGKALKGIPRDTYALVGMIGHDFYKGERSGSKGYPRFTDPLLRGTADYADYIQMATEKSLERCGVDRFDCLMLHNPDFTGYRSEAVWKGMVRMKDQRLAGCLGVAPGPANGFTLDLLLNFERFAGVVEWGMVILNPLEPWPGRMCLSGARKHGVKLMTRVVDHGGLFHGDVKPGHEFAKYDHRSYRPAGWVESGNVKIDQMRPIAERHGLSLLQLACLWNLAHEPVRSVIPTLIQEIGIQARSIEEKVLDLSKLPEITLSAEEVEEIARLGENKGCMALKGGNPEHSGESLPDRWVLNAELLDVAQRWGVEPERDLVCLHR